MLHTIQEIAIAGPGTLHITYDDGETSEVDFSPLIQKGGIFAQLADPEFFAQVQISGDRRYIVWPGEIDFCADALRVRELSSIE